VERGVRRLGAGLIGKLTAPDARERFEFNRRIMTCHDDLDLGLTPDIPGTPGLLPLEADRVAWVVGHLGVPATTDVAVRVLTHPTTASARSTPGSAG
jgi:DNA polymerase-1